jgi:hypothetical protein
MLKRLLKNATKAFFSLIWNEWPLLLSCIALALMLLYLAR